MADSGIRDQWCRYGMVCTDDARHVAALLVCGSAAPRHRPALGPRYRAVRCVNANPMCGPLHSIAVAEGIRHVNIVDLFCDAGLALDTGRGAAGMDWQPAQEALRAEPRPDPSAILAG